jgi:hypothetical protein
LHTTGFVQWKSDMNARTLRDMNEKSTIGSHVRDGSWLAAIVAGSIGAPGGCSLPDALMTSCSWALSTRS